MRLAAGWLVFAVACGGMAERRIDDDAANGSSRAGSGGSVAGDHPCDFTGACLLGKAGSGGSAGSISVTAGSGGQGEDQEQPTAGGAPDEDPEQPGAAGAGGVPEPGNCSFQKVTVIPSENSPTDGCEATYLCE